MLVYGEGVCEEVFVKHIKGLYGQNSGISIKVRNGKGGDPLSVVQNALREPGSYDHVVVIIDNDKPESEMSSARATAKGRGLLLIEHTPCLEAVLLSILNSGTSYARKTSPWCKSKFESEHIDKQKRREFHMYERVFPKELLDQQRKKVVELDRIIRIIEGNVE